VSTLNSDIREGIYTPPHLAAPGINAGVADFIDQALQPPGKGEARPLVRDLLALLDGKNGKEDFFHTLTPEETAKIEKERQNEAKLRSRTVKSRRFLTRNHAIILAIVAGVLLVAIFVVSAVMDNMSKFNTKGLTPTQVVDDFYASVTGLDTETL
jgi:hypothetical protein